MNDKQCNEWLRAYTKETLTTMIKADVRNRFQEPYASLLCNSLIILRMLQTSLRRLQK